MVFFSLFTGKSWEALAGSLRRTSSGAHFLSEIHEISKQVPSLLCSLDRPLYPPSTDVNDELALTPGHFAVQRSLKAPPTTLTALKSLLASAENGFLYNNYNRSFGLDFRMSIYPPFKSDENGFNHKRT
uniref:Uncharacterized protein n=1 Tax=Megaselia scalaris TaxID=36166 RepID=T1GUY0_MEGSC